MLHVHRAERADVLADTLAEVLSDPLTDPFLPEVVAVPAQGVERWLAQRLAHRLGAGPGRADGVCANVTFLSPAALVHAALHGPDDPDPDDDPWRPTRAVWPLLEVLDACVDEPWCGPLAAHLRPPDDPDGAPLPGRRYTVARRIAELFWSYAIHRPDLLHAWSAGDDTAVPGDLRWQPELWRLLRTRIDEPDPAERLAAATAALRTDPGRTDLPPRISLFAPTRLPTDHLGVLDALAQHREVHLWLPHPSPRLWAKVAELPRSPVVPSRRDDPSRDTARHPLLASLGRDVRELQVRLATLTAVDHHHPAPEPPPTLLGRLQADLRDDRPPRGDFTPDPTDHSVQVHACHGPARQVEVLREVILGLLAADPTLELRDVLVMCPALETFAPLITATFDLDLEQDLTGPREEIHPGHRLQVRLADRALRATNPVLDVASRVLELADARLTTSQVLDLLATAPVRRRFHLDADDLDRLRELTTTSGVRWGVDAAHRRPFRLDGFAQNTWAAGLDRMLLGVAMDESDLHWLGTALPMSEIDSGDVELVGKLAEFIERLSAAVTALSGRQPLARWVAALTEALDALTATEPTETWQATQARAELADIVRAAGPYAEEVPLGLADVRSLLADRLRGRPGRASFRTGALTVCTMAPMRSVPHRVVCLLGMDDGVFPRAGAQDGDDLLARDPRVGERDARSEDRQAFLDAVTAATEHLVVLYSGADERTGAPRPPAVPLGELLDTIAATAGPEVLDRVVIRHPLQPFDPRNFVPGRLGTPGPFSFDRTELAGARAALTAKTPPPPLLPHPLPPPEEDVVALDDLVRFVEHPVRAFLQQRVELSTFQDDEDPRDGIPVELDGLDKFSVGKRLLRDRLTGNDLKRCTEAEWRRGTLPPGRLGSTTLTQVLEDVEAIVARAGEFLVDEPDSHTVDVLLPDGTRVVGTVGDLRGRHLVHVTYQRVDAKHRLGAWVRLVALTAAAPDRPWCAVTVGRARRSGATVVTTGPVPAERARRALADLVALRREGLRAPLPLPPRSALTYARVRVSGGSPADALDAATREWCGRRFAEGSEDRAYALAFGDRPGPEVLTTPAPGDEGEPTRFGTLAMRLWTPVLDVEDVR